MAKSIFEKMANVREVNQMAAELRRLGMKDKLKELADKNQVVNEDFEDYLRGKRYFLIDAGDTVESYDTARAKLMDEMAALKDPMFGDIIGKFLIQCCGDSAFEVMVLQTHKTLQRCIGYLMEQAYGLVDEDRKNSRRMTAVAMTSDQVFTWAKDYYALDDKASLEDERKKAEEAFENRNRPKEKKQTGGRKKKSDKKSASIKKEKSALADISEGTVEKPEEQEKRMQKAEKGQIEGQVSLFGLEDVV